MGDGRVHLLVDPETHARLRSSSRQSGVPIVEMIRGLARSAWRGCRPHEPPKAPPKPYALPRSRSAPPDGSDAG